MCTSLAIGRVPELRIGKRPADVQGSCDISHIFRDWTIKSAPLGGKIDPGPRCLCISEHQTSAEQPTRIWLTPATVLKIMMSKACEYNMICYRDSHRGDRRLGCWWLRNGTRSQLVSSALASTQSIDIWRQSSMVNKSVYNSSADGNLIAIFTSTKAMKENTFIYYI